MTELEQAWRAWRSLSRPDRSKFLSLLRQAYAREREAAAWAYVLPKNSADLIGMGRSFAKTIFLSAGNITHTPAYGHLISLGVLTAVQEQNVSPQQIENAMAYRAMIARTKIFNDITGVTHVHEAWSSGYRPHRHPCIIGGGASVH